MDDGIHENVQHSVARGAGRGVVHRIALLAPAAAGSLLARSLAAGPEGKKPKRAIGNLPTKRHAEEA